MSKYPCLKQTVTASAVVGGIHYVGQNWIANWQLECPRDTLGMKSGEGYEICQEQCGQPAHAEIDLIKNLPNGNLHGADVIIRGHTYACEPCYKALHRANCGEVIFET